MATTIKVVDARRRTEDLLLLNLDQLRLVLEVISRELQPNFPVEVIRDFETLLLRSQTFAPFKSGIIEATIRYLGKYAEVLPVVLWPPTVAGTNIDARFATRKAAVGISDRQNIAVAVGVSGRQDIAVAVAAEQLVPLLGLAFDAKQEGGSVREAFAGNLRRRPSAMIDSGTFSFPEIATYVGVTVTFDGNVRAKRPARVTFDGNVRAKLDKLRALLETMRDFYLTTSGALLSSLLTARTFSAGPASPRLARKSSARPISARVSSVRESSGPAGKALELLDTLYAQPVKYSSRLALLFDLFRLDAFHDYLLLSRGQATKLRDSLRYKKQRAHEKQLAADAKRKEFETEVKAQQFLLIFEEMFGAARAAALRKALGAEVYRPEAILGALNDKEKDMVLVEYKNQDLEWRAQIGNKCPHLKIAARMRRATSARAARNMLAKLSNYFAEDPDAKTWIYCNNCKYRAICPHVRELIEMQFRNVPYDTLRARLVKYSVQYSERSSPTAGTTYSYFCKICSEKLAEFVSEDRTAELMGFAGDLDAPVRKVVWVEALRASSNVLFPFPVDPRKFASTAVDVCYPLVMRAKMSITKRRGRRLSGDVAGTPGASFDDEDAVDPRMRLYSVLFVYAYVLNLIRSSNAPKAPEQHRLGFANVRPGSPMSKYAEAILTAVLKNHSGLISRIEDMTVEFVTERFREAYKMTAQLEGEQVLVPANEAQLVVAEIVDLDPAYHFARLVSELAAPKKAPRKAPRKKQSPDAEVEDARREFETVVGASLPDILALRAADVKTEWVRRVLGVRPAGQGGVRKIAVEYPHGADPDLVYAKPEVNFWRRLYSLPRRAARAEAAANKKLAQLASRSVVKYYVGAAESDLPENSAAESDLPENSTATVRAAKPRTSAKRAAKARTVAKHAAKARTTAKRAAKARPAAKAKYAEFDRTPFVYGEISRLFRSYDLFHQYVAKVDTEKKWATFRAQLADENLIEKGYLLLRGACAIKNWRNNGQQKSWRSRFASSDTNIYGSEYVKLSYLYDEQGLPHTWAQKNDKFSLYVYSGGVKYTKAQIVDKIDAAFEEKRRESVIAGRKLVDVFCPRCETFLSKYAELDEEKVSESLRIVREFTAFFSFYSVRCPAGGFHEMTDDSAKGKGLLEKKSVKCAKCGLSETLIYRFKTDTAEARAYYDKYVDRYASQKKLLFGADVYVSESSEKPPVISDVKWKYDFGAVVRAAALIDAPPSAVESIGDTEGRLYSEVLEKVDEPPRPTSKDDPRLLAADSAARTLITEYNRVRFTHKFAKIPLASEVLLAEVPRSEYAALPDWLGDISHIYTDNLDAIRHTRSPSDILLYITESIARMTLSVAGDVSGQDTKQKEATKQKEVVEQKPTPKWLPALREKLAKTLLQNIVTSESLLSKNGPFDFNIFSEPGGDIEIDDATSPGELPFDDFGSPNEDADDMYSLAMGEEEADDPFSLAAVDIDEDSPNLEPD